VKTPIAQLLEKASSALPPQRPSRCSWAPFEPVIHQLRANGYDTAQAVDWLVAQGEITKANRDVAYRSLRQLLLRRQPKSKA
jgi:hypothetical protein